MEDVVDGLREGGEAPAEDAQRRQRRHSDGERAIFDHVTLHMHHCAIKDYSERQQDRWVMNVHRRTMYNMDVYSRGQAQETTGS